MKLLKVYRHPGVNDTYHFDQWVKRTNPQAVIVDGLKVNVSIKMGRRRKLKTMTLSWRYHNFCSCCEPWIEMGWK